MAEQAVAVAATAHIETQHDVPPVHKHIRRAGDVFGILAASEPVKYQDSRTALTVDHIVWSCTTPEIFRSPDLNVTFLPKEPPPLFVRYTRTL